MFLKQGAYKPRTGSGSQGSDKAATRNSMDSGSASKITEATGPAASAGAAGRRRSSATPDKFAGLTAHKRSSQDEKRTSYAEQKVGGSGGILGGMWQNFTKGT